MVARTLLAPVFVCLALLAQSDKPAKAIKVQVNEVIVPVTVTDEKGRFVSNLEAKDFKIWTRARSSTSSSSATTAISRWWWDS